MKEKGRLSALAALHVVSTITDFSRGELRQNIEYSGTRFPRLSRAYEDELLDAVAVAEFSLRLVGILTSLLREFMGANVTLYPQGLRQHEADKINRMVRHPKANDLFHGWDFLALANFMLNQRSLSFHSNHTLLLTP